MDTNFALALRINAEFIESDPVYKGQFDQFMPRRIMPPSGYMHPRFWWSTAFSVIHPDMREMGFTPPKQLTDCVVDAAGALRRLNAPTYFPSRELIDALDKTDVSNIDFADVRFPADSVMFVFPIEPPYMPYSMDFMEQKIMVAPVAVTLSRFVAAVQVDDGSQTTLRDRPVLEGTMLDTKGDMGWVRIPCEGPWSDTMEKYGSKMVYDRNGIPVDPADNPLVNMDSAQTQWAFRMGMKLLIAMNTVGDIHAPGPYLARPANPKKGKGELWQGQVMTLSRAISSSENGSHASPRFHLRRGHMRQQRHGERNSLVKTVWIKPTWVGTRDHGVVPEEQKA